MPTPNLALVPLAAAQSQKHVTVNEALARLDAAAQLTVRDSTRTAPPAAPLNGDRHLIAPSPVGEWAGHADDIAAWDAPAQGWIFLSPHEGWQAWVVADQHTLRFDGTEWSVATPDRLGVNATADQTNRLSVASDAVLLNHNGGGMQAKLNKASDDDTASILFQSDFKGYAEIGLTGGTDLQIKTSPDGISFTPALSINAQTGAATLPAPALIGGVAVNADLALNLLPDQGRFGGAGINSVLTANNFVEPAYLNPINGSAFAGHARFLHNNSTYGGPAGDLDPEIDALLTLIRDPNRRRFGSEWWAMQITKGGGTTAPLVQDNVTRYPVIRAIGAPLPRAYTVGFYLRVLTGSAFLDQDFTSRFARWGVDQTGNLSAGVVEPSDGWVFIERQMTFNGFGYNTGAVQIYLEQDGDAMLFALPRIVVGHVTLDPYLPGPLPNAWCFG